MWNKDPSLLKERLWRCRRHFSGSRKKKTTEHSVFRRLDSTEDPIFRSEDEVFPSTAHMIHESEPTEDPTYPRGKTKSSKKEDWIFRGLGPTEDRIFYMEDLIFRQTHPKED